MRPRCALVLLVVLALSAALLSAPAGSATQAQVSTPNEQAVGGPQLKDGGGAPPDGNSGDDDRWGNARPDGGGAPGNPGDCAGEAPLTTTKAFSVWFQMRTLFGLVIVTLTLR